MKLRASCDVLLFDEFMMINYKHFLTALLFIIHFAPVTFAQQTFCDTIPLGGNAWVNAPALITDDGVTQWRDASSEISIYFRTDVAQTFDVSLRLQVPRGKSEIQVSSGKSIYTKQISSPNWRLVHIGNITATEPGYCRLYMKGTRKTGDVFANVSHLIVTHHERDTTLVYVKKGSSYHFGRRGPSVHLNFMPPDEIKSDVRWWYNELFIPKGNDKMGSYFMADGFGEGYFGMQVNSDRERRVLFSVWSPFETDDPASVPDTAKVKLVKKGSDVITNEFGNEGAGGQSFLRFNWSTDKTYAFLLGAQPDSIHHTTTYTAYFKDVAEDKWYLIASFTRPQTLTYLTHLYSFLENFIPETGDEQREGWYQNQWVRDGNGKWHELVKAKFTVDATARGGYRKDYAGGAGNHHFFLRNDGFFGDFVTPDQIFTRQPSGTEPVIRFADLP